MYTEEEVEKAARILCERSGAKGDVAWLMPLATQSIRDHINSPEASALKQAKGADQCPQITR